MTGSSIRLAGEEREHGQGQTGTQDMAGLAKIVYEESGRQDTDPFFMLLGLPSSPTYTQCPGCLSPPLPNGGGILSETQVTQTLAFGSFPYISL